MSRLLPNIEPELAKQCAFGVVVPSRAKRREVVQRVANGHPRIERNVIRHVGEARLDGHFVTHRVGTKPLALAARGPQQTQQALDRRRLAGAVAPEEAVAAARLHAKTETVDGVSASVATHEVIDLDG